ncbi:MAG TPA: DUF4268 domain-containing protein [Cyanobacteria bacterium UBA11372]|nr:DUF4268 domain-containing protein [Cyanobacteria bacterium UBA11372]
MPFTVQDLIKDKQKPVIVDPDDLAQRAVELMIEHDFSQIPVVDRQEKLLGIVTSDVVLRAVKNLNVPLKELKVYPHAMSKLNKKILFRADEDLFALLDSLKDTNAVLIVDGEDKLTGIVTSYDTTEYFRRRAEDIMLVEDIESTLKDYVRAAFNQPVGEDDQQELKDAIKEITGSTRENIGRFENGIIHYIELQSGSKHELNKADAETAFTKVFKDKDSEPKPFDKLTLYEYTKLFFITKSWSCYSSILAIEKKVMNELLEAVRITRNSLAHFRDEITPMQREQLRYCSQLLASCQSAISEVSQTDINDPVEEEIVSNEPPNDDYSLSASDQQEIVSKDEEPTPKESRLAALALRLQQQQVGHDKLSLTFKEIENMISGGLPTAARQHRSWWANDSVSHPQSQQWLNVGWCVSTVDVIEEKVTFTRIKKQQQAYILFFSALIAELEKSATFKVKPPLSQDGRHFVSVGVIPEEGQPAGNLAFAFTRYKQLRIELYIGKSDQTENKRIFDALEKCKNEIEDELGEQLYWERIDHRQESRIALYHEGAITDSEKDLMNLRNWAVNAMIRFQNVMNRKVKEILY